MSMESSDKRVDIETELEDLRNLINPNEWNNIPACIRNVIMGIIDFNDKITTRMVNENTILNSKILSMDDRNVRQQSSMKFQFDEVSAKIDREI